MCFWLKKDKTPTTTAKQLAEKCDTPDKIVAWVHRNIWYKKDEQVHGKKEYWQTSEETLRLKSGDCEDFSVLISDALTHLGIKSYVLAIQPEVGHGHAICVYGHNGNLYGASNDRTKYVLGGGDVQDIAKKVFKNWKSATIYYTHTIKDGKNKPVKCIWRGVEL